MAATLQKLHKLDELLAVIDSCSPADEAELAHEHAQGARTYLLGAMPNEFRLNLELAQETVARMDDTEAPRKVQKILATLLQRKRSLSDWHMP